MSHEDVGDAPVVVFEVRDDDGKLVNASTVVLTVTRPDLTTTLPSVANPPTVTGVYKVTYLLAAAGRHIFSWVATVPNRADSMVIDAVAPGNLPVLADVEAYLGASAVSWTSPELQSALDAEKAAQARVCRVGAVYSDDLREALLRRVQRNLALRGLPLAVLQGDAEAGSVVLPGRDPEVRRLEGPVRKMLVG